MEEELEIIPEDNWKPKVLVIGGVVGLLTGLLGAYLLIQRSEKTDTKPELSAGEGVKLGVLVMGLLRSVAMIADK